MNFFPESAIQCFLIKLSLVLDEKFSMRRSTKSLVLCSVLILFLKASNSKLEVYEGNLLYSARILQTQSGKRISILDNSIRQEMSELGDIKARILCEPEKNGCKPLRYDIFPFPESTSGEPWTIRPLPLYISRGIYAFNPSVSADGNFLFWTSYLKRNGSFTQKIWYSQKDEHGFWMPGEEMKAPLNNKNPSAAITALPGGNELLVFGRFGEEELVDSLREEMNSKSMKAVQSARNHSDAKSRVERLQEEYKNRLNAIYERVPLYYTHRVGTSWAKPQSLNFPDFYNLYRKEDNPNQEIFGGSTLSASGQALIYSAMHKDSRGKLDLYVSVKDSDGMYHLGKNLGSVVNSSGEDMAPFLASDNRTLYFSSQNQKGVSIYMSKRIGSDWQEWTRPVKVSEKLNGVNFFTIPAKGNWAYMSRDGKLEMAYLPNEFKPEPVVLIQGTLTDTNGNPLSGTISYESLSSLSKEGSVQSDPQTGKFSLVLPYGDRYGFYAEKSGYLPVSRNLNLETKDKNQEEMQVHLQLPRLEKGREIQIHNLFFETGSSEITRESRPELDRLARILEENPEIRVQIAGHTDDVGKSKDNLHLSEKRAESVREYLIHSPKIDRSRIETVGYGESSPIAPNDNEENRRKNRRVVFSIVE